MIVRSVCWSIFLCLALRPEVKAQVQVIEQGYKNVLISFAPNVAADHGESYVQTLKELLENTSSVLHTAIGIRIATVTFHLPTSWDTRKWENFVNPVLEQQDRRPDIWVDATEQSPFGKQPVTLQHGGCGIAGHQITLPVDFLNSAHEYPKGKLLAREWLKYRYGVFEENGFEKDSLYPDYYRIPGRSEITITECTNSEVTYTFKNNDGETCNMTTTEEFGSCKTHPDDESAANITSSLMYFHESLPNMEHVCGKDHRHQMNTRSKQNALCNGKSIWEVLHLSDDFKDIPDQPADYESVQFSFIQDSRPRVVVLLENSDNLVDKESSIKFALKRFYYDLPALSKFGIYTYNNEATEVFTYAEIPAQERSALSLSKMDFGYSEANICASCGLKKAPEILLSDSEPVKGSILWIGASRLDALPEFSEKLKGSGICLNALRLVDEDPEDETYKDLESSFDCYSYITLSTSSDDLQSFNSFYSFLKTPVPDDSDIETVASESMKAGNPLKIPHNPTASLYTLWLARSITSNSIECRAGDKDVTLTLNTEPSDIVSYKFDPQEDVVTCSLKSSKLPSVLTQVRMSRRDSFNFDTWIHDASTDTEQMPIIIYAKVYFGGYPVKNATVTTTVVGPDNVEEIVRMLDNGRGDPDITQHDGLYSGYFTGFSAPGEYKITVKVNDNQGAANLGKHLQSSPIKLGSDTCCGSQVISDNEVVPAFDMEKNIVYNAIGKRPDDGYKPSRIIDLQVETFNPPHFVALTWTAPGGGKASSYEFYAFCDSQNCSEDGRLPEWLELNQTQPKPKSYGEPEEVVFLFTSEIPMTENLTVFFALKSVAEIGKLSDMSNKAEIFLSSSDQPPTTAAPIIDDIRKLSASDTTGIIVGSTIAGVCLLICIGAVFYFYVLKPRRHTKPSDIDSNGYFQDKDQSGTEVSGSFRAVPTGHRGPSSMRRVESFPVLLYTHDQIKGHKKKVDPPLYKPAIAPRPWMSMNVLSNSEQGKASDSKSIGSASTLPMNDKHRSAEMKQLDDVSLTSEAPPSAEAIKF